MAASSSAAPWTSPAAKDRPTAGSARPGRLAPARARPRPDAGRRAPPPPVSPGQDEHEPSARSPCWLACWVGVPSSGPIHRAPQPAPPPRPGRGRANLRPPLQMGSTHLCFLLCALADTLGDVATVRSTSPSEPVFSTDPAATADVAVGYDYYVDDRTPTVELPGVWGGNDQGLQLL